MTKNRTKYITERIKVTKLIPGGQALGQLENGKKIFLWGILPGETVTEYQVTKEKSHFVEAIATQIENPSPQRVAPRDDCYLATSPWQIMNYDYELEQKAVILREILRQHQITWETVPAVQTNGQDFHYRNKMEYSLYYDQATTQIYPAFHRRGSHQKVIVEQSSIERTEIWQKAQEIITTLNHNGDEARRYQSLLLRCDQKGDVSGGLVEKYQSQPKFPLLQDAILGYQYSYSPNGFFQINLPVYEMALNEIKRWIKTDSVLDLYAGVGTIGLSVARDHTLTLVECNAAAYQEMVKNCQQVEKTANARVQPVLAKSEDALEYIQPEQTVVLDPPRAGCEMKLLERILGQEPQAVIYLSCNPATQARDVRILEEKYRIAKVQPYNFFPRTPHLENLIVLELEKAKNGTK